MNDLKEICRRYMNDNLTIESVLLYWRLGGKYKLVELVKKCQTRVGRNLRKLSLSPGLKNVTEKMLQILAVDELNFDREIEVCEFLLKWLEVQKLAGKDVSRASELLTVIRWSGIGVDYVKTNLLHNVILTSDPACGTYLARVLEYLLSGVPFHGLKTFHRPATGLDNCLLVVGLDCNDEKAVSNSVYSISLQHPDRTTLLGGIPTEMLVESACCSSGSTVFVTGVGPTQQNQLWRWELLSGWIRCADMIEERRRHCVTVVDSVLFVLGGFSRAKNVVLSTVDCYSSRTNKWTPAGELIHAVESAACVTYKNSIYVFGGFERNGRPIDYVQIYNTAKNRCKVSGEPIPHAGGLMRAVMWDLSVILLHRNTCYVYYLDTGTWLERKQFKAEFIHFAAVLDNETIYIAGGGVSTSNTCTPVDENWVETDEMKSVSVYDILSDRPAVWRHHAKLARPSCIHSFASITLPCLVNQSKGFLSIKRKM